MRLADLRRAELTLVHLERILEILECGEPEELPLLGLT